ncbi:hypothetical protein CRG98_032790 [Punica granatum]|uniref:Uncharacterized protein n=1 Tax=Punica granatum TaxID=22663 RepID=A0A2I0ISW0_PUNGR|nr:hypothetical protein CRG98_032790 [Punica granatum]
MDTKSWTRSPKSGNVEATTSVREWRGAPKRGAWHWVVALLGWCNAGLAAEAIACWECPGLAYGIFACEAVARCWLGGCSFARDRRLAMRDSSSESAYIPSWTGDQSLP